MLGLPAAADTAAAPGRGGLAERDTAQAAGFPTASSQALFAHGADKNSPSASVKKSPPSRAVVKVRKRGWPAPRCASAPDVLERLRKRGGHVLQRDAASAAVAARRLRYRAAPAYGRARPANSAYFQPAELSLSSSFTRKSLRQLVAERAAALEHAGLVLRDGDDDRLHRRDGRRQHQPVVVAVRHDDGADQPRRHTPRGLEGVGLDVFFIGIHNVERTGEAVAEIMARAGLEAPLPSCISASMA